MCGIAGIVQFDQAPVEPSWLQQACAALRHRGPDECGIWIGPDKATPVGLAATRLAVLDPSPAGHQPMSRQNGRFQLVYNGEIYNYKSLRGELADSGEVFATDTDTEVLLAACSRWGTDALCKLNGMWALAFYDRQAREGFLARDPFGIKPLFYCLDERRLAFASEIGPLTKLGGFTESLDSDALAEHLVFGFISGEKSIYQSVRRLEPGHFLRFAASGAAKPVRYYAPPVQAKNQPASNTVNYEERGERLRRLLTEAVVSQRVADVPLGAFLSGGLDSSIVVAHLSEAIGRPIQTFSVGYERHSNYDETSYARLAAARFGTEHHEMVLSERDVLEAIPNVLDHLREPVGDSSIIPTALLSQFTRQHVTVALSGDAGDELFGGYWRYLAHGSLESYRRIPVWLRRGVLEPLAAASSAAKGWVMADRVRQFRKFLRVETGTEVRGAWSNGNVLARHLAWSRILSPEAASVLLSNGWAQRCEEAALNRAVSLNVGLDAADPLNGVLAFDLLHQLPADMLQKVDLASMMHSLEVRVPFLDPAVVAFTLSLPSRFKIEGGLRKRILVDAYRGYVPDEILDRPKKGFEVPIGEFLRGPLRPMFHDVVTRDAVDSFGLLSYDGVETIYADHLARRNDHADVLFALLSLCGWHRRLA